MGSRIGYSARYRGEDSPILRKQWKTSIKEAVCRTWQILLDGHDVGHGLCALRDDLAEDRAFAALCCAVYEPPFDSIHKDANCDISDNGLIVIDVTQFQNWKIYQHEVNFETGEVGHPTLIAVMSEYGFKWVVSDKEREEIGEGLD